MHPVLPFATEDVPPIPGRFRATQEDFLVDEIPVYPPSGKGDHVLLRFEKRGLNTKEAIRRIATASGANEAASGWAGLKDRHAVTRQWASLFGVTPEDVLGVDVEDVTVLEADRHDKKLRTGHLRGNRFELLIRDTPDERVSDVQAIVERLTENGMPNYFGEQRFGHGGQNLEHAKRWIIDRGKAPKSRFKRKLLVSVLQAALFNERVAARVRNKELGRAFMGDVMRKEDTGGLFAVDDVEEAQGRCDRWEISPTGPMFGAKMQWPEGAARAHEQALIAKAGLSPERLQELRAAGPGTRRVVRVRPTDVEITPVPDGLRLRFTLPKGSYATVLLREILKRDAEALSGR